MRKIVLALMGLVMLCGTAQAQIVLAASREHCLDAIDHWHKENGRTGRVDRAAFAKVNDQGFAFMVLLGTAVLAKEFPGSDDRLVRIVKVGCGINLPR
jgi:hypothetical protein